MFHYRPPNMKLKISIFIGNNIEFDKKHLITTNEFEFIPHPNYEERPNETAVEKMNRSTNWDIAVIKLKDEIDFNSFMIDDKRQFRMNTICLPKQESKSEDKFVYKPATFFGWGKVPDNSDPVNLKRGDTLISQGDIYNGCYYGFCFISSWRPGYVTSCSVSIIIN